jgi:acyl dehydratase
MHGTFGGLIASGWYSAAILVRLFADSSEQSLAAWWFNGSLDKRIHTTPSRSGEIVRPHPVASTSSWELWDLVVRHT